MSAMSVLPYPALVWVGMAWFVLPPGVSVLPHMSLLYLPIHFSFARLLFVLETSRFFDLDIPLCVGYCVHMDFISDIAPASRVRTIPYGTLDQADLWEIEQGWDAFLAETYDPDLPYGPGMEG